MKQQWLRREREKRLGTATGTTQYGNLVSEEKGKGSRGWMTTTLFYNTGE